MRLRAWRALCFAALLFVSGAILAPIVFMLANSFMGSAEILKQYGAVVGAGPNPPAISFVPERISLRGFEAVFLRSPDYLMKFWSSLFLSLSIAAGQIVFSCFSGYGFSKFSFPLKNAVFFVLIILMMMPLQVTIIPTYIILDRAGLIGSYAAIVLPGVFSVFGVFLMNQVYSSIPTSYIEAAKIDGCSQPRIFFHIMFPSGKHGIGALAILSFIDSWNMVEQPLLLLKDATKYPLSIFLSGVNASFLDAAFVCGVLAMLPALIVYLFFKDYMVSGIQSMNF